MIVSYKSSNEVELISLDFSKRQWRKICALLGAEKNDDVLWLTIDSGAIEFACRPTEEEKMAFARKERR